MDVTKMSPNPRVIKNLLPTTRADARFKYLLISGLTRPAFTFTVQKPAFMVLMEN